MIFFSSPKLRGRYETIQESMPGKLGNYEPSVRFNKHSDSGGQSNIEDADKNVGTPPSLSSMDSIISDRGRRFLFLSSI